MMMAEQRHSDEAVVKPITLSEGIDLLKKGKIRVRFPREVKVRDYGASVIAETLLKNSTCTSLDLRYNGIGDLGLYHLARSLFENKSISKLLLGTNQITLEQRVTLTELKYDSNNKLYSTYKSSYNLLDASERNMTEEDSELEDDEYPVRAPRQDSLPMIYRSGSGRSQDSTNTQNSSDDVNVNTGRNGFNIQFGPSQRKTTGFINKATQIAQKSVDKSTIDPNPSAQAICNPSSNGIQKKAHKTMKHKTEENINLRSFLMNSMRQNNTLSYLDLSNNEIADAGARTIAEMLNVNTGLKHLNLQLNKISAKGAKYISETLEKNNTLETLLLDMTKIEDEGIGHLCAGLSKNNALKLLSLKNNGIGNDGAKSIAFMLAENTSLSSLILGNNRIGFSGTLSLAEMLPNSSLRSLDMSVNPIGTDALAFLIKSLEKNKTLLEFNLSKVNANLEKPSVLEGMQGFIRSNNSLKVLNLSQNSGSSKDIDKILAKIQNNAEPVINIIEVDGINKVELTPNAWQCVMQPLGPLVLLAALKDLEDRKLNKQIVTVIHARNNEGVTLMELATIHSGKYTCDLIKFFVEHGFNVFEESDSEQRLFIDILKESKESNICEWVNSIVDPRENQSRLRKRSSVSKFHGTVVSQSEIEMKLFSNRFNQKRMPIIYESDTCVVFWAEDRLIDRSNTQDKQGSDVVVKVFLDRERYSKEVRARQILMQRNGKEYSKYVIKGELPDEAISNIDDPNKYVIMQEYGETLYDIAHKELFAGKKIRKIQDIAFNAAKTLNFMNRNSLIHGDFTPKNFLLLDHKDRRSMEGDQWRLIDMDSSCFHEQAYSGTGKINAYSPPEFARHLFGEQKRRDSVARYEPNNSLPAKESIDVWAFGVVLYELLTGTSLFGRYHMFLAQSIHTRDVISQLANWEAYISEEKLDKVLLNADSEYNPEMTLDEIKTAKDLAKDLLFNCLHGNPKQRINFKRILKHPFFEQQADLEKSLEAEQEAARPSGRLQKSQRVTFKRMSKEDLARLKEIERKENMKTTQKKLNLENRTATESAQPKRSSSRVSGRVSVKNIVSSWGKTN